MADMDRYLEALVSGAGDMEGAVGGPSEILGNPDMIVGGPVSTPQLRHLGLLHQAGGVGVRAVIRDKVRMQPAVWPQTSITASATTTITLQPQRLIQVKSIVIPSFLGGLFDVSDLRIQQVSQFITTGRLPVQLLSEVADGNRTGLKLESCDVGALIAIDFTNLDAVNAQVIRGAVIATSVY